MNANEREQNKKLTEEVIDVLLLVRVVFVLVFCSFFSFSFSILPNSSRSQAGIFRRLALAAFDDDGGAFTSTRIIL